MPDHSTPEGRRCPECGGVTEPPTEIEAREGVRFCPRCQLYAPPAPEGGVPMVWRDCSPELLAAGVNCANTPRRPGLTPDVSHQHLVPVPTPTSAEGGEARCKCGDPACPLWREDEVCPYCSAKSAALDADPEYEGRGGDGGEGHYGECAHGERSAPTLAATGGEEDALLRRLREVTSGSKGNRPDYIATLSTANATEILRRIVEAEARATTAERRLEETTRARDFQCELRTTVESQLAAAANAIPEVSGPVYERIRVLRQHHADQLTASQQENARLTARLEEKEADLGRIYAALPDGPKCRGCADSQVAGRCDETGRPCHPADDAARYVTEAVAAQQEVARLRNLARRVLDTASSPLSSEHVAAKEVLSAALSSPHQSTGQGA